MLKAIVREPLVHFLLLGLALFLLDAWLRPPPHRQDRARSSSARRASAASPRTSAATWQRPPTREELDGLVASTIREEVFYREALALGLDRDDAIVRRRLQQKMEFVSEEAAALAQPTDDELAAYLKANPDAFRIEPRATFSQIHLDPGKRGAALDADARRLLQKLNAADTPTDPTPLGDVLMLLEPHYGNAAQAEIARLFGSDFADALSSNRSGRWVGPIPSGLRRAPRACDARAGRHAAARRRPPAGRARVVNARRTELAKSFYDTAACEVQGDRTHPGGARP